MKAQDLQRTLEETILHVFGDMYFMFPERVGEDDRAGLFPESCFRARVPLEDRPDALLLYGSERLVGDMAKNILGPDQTIGEAELIDVFKEAANVIAGNLVSRLGLDSDTALGIPEAERWHARSRPDATSGFVEIMFQLDDEALKVVLAI